MSFHLTTTIRGLLTICFLFNCLLAASPTASARMIELNHQHQHIRFDPETLAIYWGKLAVNAPSLRINHQPQSATHIVRISPSSVRWTATPGMIDIQATLTNTLTLTFTLPPQVRLQRNHPLQLQWFRLPGANTQMLYLPFSEGMRVPVRHQTWIHFLARHYNGSNTTQDLKMPFWTVRQDKSFISYQLNNPTNNRIYFSDKQPVLSMRAAHHFTPLNQKQAFEVLISRGNTSLAGAKKYRNWRKAHGLTQSLANKMKHQPEAKKIIGATQIYLFGKAGISVQDVSDWQGFSHWYLTQSGLDISEEVRREFPANATGHQRFNRYQKRLLVESVNQSLNRRYPVEKPTLTNNGIADQYHAAQQRKQWLATHAGAFLLPPRQWGQALSSEIITTLQKSGLKRLWLGLENWMPAFYQPDVVRQAKQAGYLIATYDAYNTAIPRGKNNSWLTAQFPDLIRKQCAIETADGSLKTGFKGQGYYLAPACHAGYIKQRMKDILRYGQFNSLFLDVDATAMTREDYRHHTSEMTMLADFNRRMNWLAAHENVVTASEDGNSLTTRGLILAHGMESVGFGWTDPDMKKNQHSPYYLGRWYPDDKPEFFFKPAKVKSPYKQLLFSPEFRIPLYQAVFHDEIINSQHWHTDNLKFSDVKIQRDLTGMLYNTPPMVHLTRDEASPHSRRIRELKHYQAGYLPLHQQLWNQQLAGFQWLDQQGQVQQTTFSDGSTITANFTAKPFRLGQMQVEPFSILAQLKGQRPLRWQAYHD